MSRRPQHPKDRRHELRTRFILEDCPTDISKHRQKYPCTPKAMDRDDRICLYFAVTILIVLACYLHLVGLAQKSSFESYQAGYTQGFDDALAEVRQP